MTRRPLASGGCSKHGPRDIRISRGAAAHDLLEHQLLLSVHMNDHPSRLHEGEQFTTYGRGAARTELAVTSTCERGRIKTYIFTPGEG